MTESSNIFTAFPKTDRRKLTTDRKYEILFQHTLTKVVTILPVTDLSINDIRFVFELDLKDIDAGFSDYYILAREEWERLNIDDIRKSKVNVIDEELFINSIKIDIIQSGLYQLIIETPESPVFVSDRTYIAYNPNK